MSNFEDILKKKLESFEVPFNEDHWNEMDRKLDGIKKVKFIKNSVLAITSLAAILIGVYFIANHSNVCLNTKLNTSTAIISKQTPKTTYSNNGVKLDENNNNNTIQNTAKQKTLSKVENQEQKTVQNNVSTEQPIKSTEISKNSAIFQENLSADFISSNNKICLGGEVSFEALEKKDLTAFTWDFGDGATSTKQNPTHQYKNAGNFSVSLTVTNKRTNEEVKTSQRNSIVIYPLPNADFSYVEQSSQFDDNKLKYPTTIFNYKGDSADLCDWIFGNGKTSKAKSPAIVFEKKGDYLVTLKAKNEFGCTNSISKPIQINTSFELFAPNAFTPNFDGNNDEFMPEALQTWDIKFELIIKNKSGNVIYTTKDKNEGWKGSQNNQGSVLDEDLYFWQVFTYDVDGKPYQHFGKINLIK